MATDKWLGFKFPKTGQTPKTRKDKRNRDARTVAADDRSTVFDRQRYQCFAWGISPVCTGRVWDPHELVPVSKGGKRISPNRVGLCRACHGATDSTLGGRRLFFDWPGKAEGKPPNADKRGHVTCRWQERKTRHEGQSGADHRGQGVRVPDGRKRHRTVLPSQPGPERGVDGPEGRRPGDVRPGQGTEGGPGPERQPGQLTPEPDEAGDTEATKGTTRCSV